MKSLFVVLCAVAVLAIVGPAQACPNSGLGLNFSQQDLLFLQGSSFAGNGFQTGFGAVPFVGGGGGIFNLATGAGAANVNIGGFGRNLGGRNFNRGRGRNVIRQRNVIRRRR